VKGYLLLLRLGAFVLSSLSCGSVRLSAALLVLAGVLWGAGGLAGALLQTAAGIGPVAVAAYRLLVGGGISLLFVASRLRGCGRLSLSFGCLSPVGCLLLFKLPTRLPLPGSGLVSTLITIGCVPLLLLG
jgi:DME family drug/metabolite transporter